MRAIFTNARIVLVCDTPHDTRMTIAFSKAMSFFVEGAYFQPSYREGRWDGYERLISRRKGGDVTSFLTHARPPEGRPDTAPDTSGRAEGGTAQEGAPGLPWWAKPGNSVWVAPVGLGENILAKWPDLIVIDARRPLGPSVPMSMNPNVIPSLRPYQEDAKAEILYVDEPLTGKGLVKLPTRAGKTVIAAAVFADLGLRGVFFVNSDMLLRQTVKFFEKVLTHTGEIPDGLPLVGKWGGGDYSEGWVTVVSVQSLTRHVATPESQFRTHKKRVLKKLGAMRRARKTREGTEAEVRKKIDAEIARCRGYLWEVTYEVDSQGRMVDPTIMRSASRGDVMREKHKGALRILARTDVSFFDECHHLVSNLWRNAMRDADSRYKVGLSATIHFDEENGTPLESIWLMAVTGPVVHTLTPSELIEQGWLCRPRITFKTAPDPTEDPPASDTYLAVYKWAIAENGPRNDSIVDSVLEHVAKGNRTLVTTRLVPHAKKLVELCTLAGLRAEIVIGPTAVKTRERRIEALKNGGLDVIVGTVFKEAVDIPFLETVIIGDGGASRILALQRLRNLTPVDDDDNVILVPMQTSKIVDVVDFVDGCHKHPKKHSLLRFTEYDSHDAFIIRWERE